MTTAFASGRPRLATLALTLFVTLLTGGADGCSSDPNVEGARLSIRNGDLAEASTQLGRALETNPDDVPTLVLRADVNRQRAGASTDPAERQALLDQMAADIQRAYTLAPEDENVRVIRINGWATSVTEGNQALTDQSVDASISRGLFQTAVTVMPDSSQGHFGLGLANLRADDPPAAIPHLRRVTEMEPSNVTAFVYLGRSLLLTEQTAEGITVLEEAADRFPDNADIQASLLNAYAVGGRTDEALGRYATAIATTPDDALLRYNYGVLLLNADRFDEAIEQLDRSTALDPSNGDAQYNLGAAIQNKASALTEEANATRDDAAANALIAQRDVLLNRSLTYLLRARELASQETTSGYQFDAAVNRCRGADGQFVETGLCFSEQRTACNALFQVYGQLNRPTDARGVAACAGIPMD